MPFLPVLFLQMAKNSGPHRQGMSSPFDIVAFSALMPIDEHDKMRRDVRVRHRVSRQEPSKMKRSRESADAFLVIGRLIGSIEKQYAIFQNCPAPPSYWSRSGISKPSRVG
jgi:hypothetical protein